MEVSGQLVGRRSELERLDAVLEQGRAVLLSGDPGIGKTRVVGSVAEHHQLRGQFVLASACLPLARALPLMPVVDLLRQSYIHDGGRLVDSVLQGCPDYVRQDVARVLPELGAAGATGPGEGWEQQRLFAAVGRFFGAIAIRCGLLVIIEDLQWSDRSTRDFLTYFLAHLVDQPTVRVVLTTRSDVIERAGEIRDWVQQVVHSSGVTQLKLPPLSAAEVADLVSARLGSCPSEQLIAELYSRAEGNPFFTEQLVAAGARRGAVLPEELARLLRARAETLVQLPRDVLNALSVAARAVTEQELERVTRHEPVALRRAVQELLDEQLARREANDTFSARHALVAEAVADGLLPGERAQLELAIADVLARRGDQSLCAEVARHLAAADQTGMELPVRIEAAEYAESVYAFREAAQHWERAFHLAETAADFQAGGLALRGIVAWASAGNEARGAELGLRGIELAARQGQQEITASLHARVAMLAFVDNKEKAASQLSAAVAMFTRLPPCPEEISALNRLYHMLRALGRRSEGLPYVRRAVDAGAELPTAAGPYIQALTSWAFEKAVAGDLSGAEVTMSLARATTALHPDPNAAAWLAVAETEHLVRLNHLDEAVELGERAVELVQAQGLGASFCGSLVVGAVVEALLALGRVSDAGALTDQLTEGPPEGTDLRAVHAVSCSVDVARGRLREARSRADALSALPVEFGVEVESDLSRIQAEAAIWHGAPATALAVTTKALFRLVGCEQGWLAAPLLVLGMRACADLMEATAARQDPEKRAEARAEAESLMSLARDMDADPFAEHPYFVTTTAEAAEWHAEVERCLAGGAVDAWEAAACRWEALGRPHRAAYARWRQAEVLLRSGKRTDASAALKAAWRQAEEHVPLQSEIADLGRMARLDVTTRLDSSEGVQQTTSRPAMNPYGLTTREIDVLQLLVNGLTNAQIGAKLFISPKTASVHITSILRKLEATNRVHAAAIAQRLRLTRS